MPCTLRSAFRPINALVFIRLSVVRRKTIYEYHKVDKKTDDIVSNSSIYFTALPTCVSLSSCESCVTNSIGFDCVWCPQNERCSDGTDRHRQDWLVKGCDKQSVDKNSTCSAATTTQPPPPATETSTASSVPYTKFVTNIKHKNKQYEFLMLFFLFQIPLNDNNN